MFPATAAACAAAAAWAVAACCCICLWHWRRSNTWKDREHFQCLSRKQKKTKNKRMNEWLHVECFFHIISFMLLHSNGSYEVKLTALPWCKHSGRFCEQRLLALGQLLCPGSSSEQTRRGHWGTAPTHLLHLYTPTGLLFQCEVWEVKKNKTKLRKQIIWMSYKICCLSKSLEYLKDYISCGSFVFPFKIPLIITILNRSWITYRALSIASVRCTLLSWPKQKRSPPEGSTYPSTVTTGQEDGTLNVSPTWTSISK